jgi:hypothetical protein
MILTTVRFKYCLFWSTSTSRSVIKKETDILMPRQTAVQLRACYGEASVTQQQHIALSLGNGDSHDRNNCSEWTASGNLCPEGVHKSYSGTLFLSATHWLGYVRTRASADAQAPGDALTQSWGLAILCHSMKFNQAISKKTNLLNLNLQASPFTLKITLSLPTKNEQLKWRSCHVG